MIGVFQGKIRPLGVEGLMMPSHVLSHYTDHTVFFSPLLPQAIKQATIRQFHNDFVFSEM